MSYNQQHQSNHRVQDNPAAHQGGSYQEPPLVENNTLERRPDPQSTALSLGQGPTTQTTYLCGGKIIMYLSCCFANITLEIFSNDVPAPEYTPREQPFQQDLPEQDTPEQDASPKTVFDSHEFKDPTLKKQYVREWHKWQGPVPDTSHKLCVEVCGPSPDTVPVRRGKNGYNQTMQ